MKLILNFERILLSIDFFIRRRNARNNSNLEIVASRVSFLFFFSFFFERERFLKKSEFYLKLILNFERILVSIYLFDDDRNGEIIEKK